MAKTFKYRKNVWEDGSKSSKQKTPSRNARKKKYNPYEIVDDEDLNYDRLY